jgi:hypothetical protein
MTERGWFKNDVPQMAWTFLSYQYSHGIVKVSIEVKHGKFVTYPEWYATWIRGGDDEDEDEE